MTSPLTVPRSDVGSAQPETCPRKGPLDRPLSEPASIGAVAERAIVLLGAVASSMLDAMRGGSTPIIFVGRRDPSGEIGRFVGIDNTKAGRDVAAWALSRDLREAAIIHGPLTSSATRDRIEAISDAYRLAGFPVSSTRRIAPSGHDHLEMGFNGAKTLHQQGETLDLIITRGCESVDSVAAAFRISGQSSQ